MIKKTINSFGFAWNGIKAVWKKEQNFRIEIVIGLLVFFLALYFRFTFTELIFCIITIVMVLGAEMVNTAIEDLCNKIEPNHDPVIGKIKDIMAAFVLVSVKGAIVIGLIVAYHHFFM